MSRKKDLDFILIRPDTSILEVIEVIDKSMLKIAFAVDGNKKLLGTITDGDIRRGILKGISLQDTAEAVMNRYPKAASVSDRPEDVLELMRKRQIHCMPVLDAERRVVGIELLASSERPDERPNWIVLMAGGLGTRLKPLTDDRPKPLLKVGDKPILETIIERFAKEGFRKIFLCVNHMDGMLREHFKDGSKWGVNLRYIQEPEKLGTAGALGLLPERPIDPIFVMNADVLTKVNFRHLLDFHEDHKAMATMCVKEYDFQVPFGVVKLDQHGISGIDEKPVQRFFVNAGIYVLEPEVLGRIPPGSHVDMPILFHHLIREGCPTAAFPIREYWMDVGRMDDLERANGEFSKHFS